MDLTGLPAVFLFFMNRTTVNNLTTDYRVEVIAAQLFEQSGNLGDIIINRSPALARPHTKDLTGITQEPGWDNTLRWLLSTHRESLYEMLPENLFHEPTLGTMQSSEEEIIHRIRKHRVEEAQARSFFGPYEQEVQYLNILMYALETRICRTNSDDLIHIFEKAWPFLSVIDPHSARVFIHILPFLHQVKGDFRWTEKYIGLFTGLPVHITEYGRTIEPEAPEPYYTLGGQMLGNTMLLYGPAAGSTTDLNITIGPVPEGQMEQYLPGSAFNAILEELYQHFIPCNKAYRQQVIMAEPDRSFVLGHAEHSAVGYATFL